MGTDMGYRDDFYIVENMCGYTGKINEKPTVYFKSATEYGRITQDHVHKDNIGRNEVRNANGYTIRNESINRGPAAAVERRGERVVHTSRHRIILIGQVSPGDRAILSQSIWTYKDLKKKAWLSPIAEETEEED
jgi:hypothetical protein